MSKKRVYEIARERGLETKQVMKRLQMAGVEVKAAASTVDDADIDRVFGAKVEPARPGSGALPSWLSPTSSAAPKTTSRAEIDATKAAATAKVDAAKSAKQKAIEQAKRVRAQRAAQQQEAAVESARRVAEQAEAAEAAEAAAQAEANAIVDAEIRAAEAAEACAAEQAVEPDEAATEDVPAEVTSAPVAAPPEAATEPEAVPVPEVTTAMAAALAAAESEAEHEAAASAEPKRVGPRIISAAPTPVAEPVVVAAPEPEVVVTQDVPLTEAQQRKAAQAVAHQRVAELAAKRRAEIEREKLETEQRKRDEAKGIAKKDKKKKKEDEAGTPGATTGEPEFIGSRKPRVGGASRDADAGGRRGPSKRRRVVIDSGANRRGGGDQGRGRGGKRGRGGSRSEPVVIDYEAPVTIHAGATVKELADALQIAATEVIKVLMQGGDFVTITQTLTADQMELVGIGLEPPREIIVKSAADEEVIPVFEDAEEDLVMRAPVVTIMGHVDHGKTSLLDAIRETKVAAGEAGGITQHIGAYQVAMPDGRQVTFLDTPGHEAFTALRARGAEVTDEVVLVVAADDGVKPQTIEAIDHARAANVPILVAVNKIDKENAQPEKVKAELAQHDLQPEEWGGTTVVCEVSAKQRLNLDHLIEMILLQADILELKANPNADASGYIIESKLEPGRGPVCTMLVARGTLKVGDIVLAGATYGKVRALNDFLGQRVKTAGPAMPVEIVGFNDVPDAGEFCQVVENERVAREQANKRAIRRRVELQAKRQRGLTLDDLFNRIKEGEVNELNLVLKADVAGSIEALEQELGKIQHSEVKVRIIHSGVGAITGNDINLASASNAIVLGFNVRPNAEAKTLADREGVDVRSYRVIYKLREDVENALSGLLSPEEVEETTGEAEIRQVFRASRIGTIAGCMVTQGQVERSSRIRLLRDGAIVHEGTISSLKRFKDDVREVATGFECGISIENYNDMKEGDVIEAYIVKQVERDITSELAASGAPAR